MFADTNLKSVGKFKLGPEDRPVCGSPGQMGHLARNFVPAQAGYLITSRHTYLPT